MFLLGNQEIDEENGTRDKDAEGLDAREIPSGPEARKIGTCL